VELATQAARPLWPTDQENSLSLTSLQRCQRHKDVMFLQWDPEEVKIALRNQRLHLQIKDCIFKKKIDLALVGNGNCAMQV
jgi:hypothetical protein